MATVLLPDPDHPQYRTIQAWCGDNGVGFNRAIDSDDVLFALSCTRKIAAQERAKYGRCYVIHESELPRGRGWSPLAWQILAGQKVIPVSLIEMAEEIDAGPIYAQTEVYLEGHELWDEIHGKVAQAKIALMERALHEELAPTPQEGIASKFARRTPDDSRLDVDGSIRDQFDLMRISDHRFPPFFEIRGHRYKVTVEKWVPTKS